MSWLTRRKFVSGFLPGSFLLLSPHVKSESNNGSEHDNCSSSNDLTMINGSLVKLDSIKDLKNVSPESVGRVLYVTSYYTGDNMCGEGGGFFYYDEEDTTSVDDSVLTFTSIYGGRWKRKLDDRNIDVSMAGLLCDGMSDETKKFIELISLLSSLGGYIINGGGRKLIVSATIEIDLSKVGLMNIDICSTILSATEAPTYILELSGSKTSNTVKYTKNNIGVMRNVTVSGQYLRDGSNINGVLIKPLVDLANIDIYSLTITKVNIGLVLGTNSYLITFSKLCIYNCNLCLADSVFSGTEKTIRNAGENIQFVSCSFANSNKVAGFYGMEAYITFDKCSFDYTGGRKYNKYVQWDIRKQGVTLNYINCHFESGNTSDSLNNYYFFTDKSVRINIHGGVMQFGNVKNNLCPYFFFDSSGMADFSLEDTFVYGLGIKKWSNCSLRKFMPEINFGTSHVSAAIQDKNYLIQDGAFFKDSIVDDWFYIKNAEPDSIIRDNLFKIVDKLTIDDKSCNFLKVTGVDNGNLYLILNRPISKFSPFISFDIKSSKQQRSSVNISLGLAKKNVSCNEQVLPVSIDVTSKANVEVSENVNKVTLGNALTFESDYLLYDCIVLNVKFSNFNEADFFITNVIVNSPF
ncbi:hypothetical protein AAFL31_29030 [Klebsiella huaxiensis]|uniref:hypothetical protein n=1 Tax=Klebsiella huaxiensis TaxID=2153354 RepID=UPI003160D45D